MPFYKYNASPLQTENHQRTNCPVERLLCTPKHRTYATGTNEQQWKNSCIKTCKKNTAKKILKLATFKELENTKKRGQETYGNTRKKI